MPACMAHYQFGQDVLNRLDGKIRSAALTYKREFDIGLQGPDIFYFYKPYRRTGIRDYGVARHNEPARRMFARILEKTQEKAALSYLMGLICHYVLDKCCHPYLYTHSRERYDHQRMESAFDKHIMLTRGVNEARYVYLPAVGLRYEVIASLWQGIDASTMSKCVRAERRAIRVLDCRTLLNACEKVFRKPGALTPMTLPDEVSRLYTAHIRQLNDLYEKAMGECPELIRTALEAMGMPPRNGLGFDLNYKGV